MATSLQSTSTRSNPNQRSNANPLSRPSNKRKQSEPENKPAAALADKPSPARGNALSIAAPDGLVEAPFRFEAPSAKTVLLVGEFTAWEKSPIKMVKDKTGVWHGIAMLRTGRHAYRFLVDGEWHNDPAQPQRVANGFGTFNNVVEISKPATDSKGKNLSTAGL